MPVKGLRDKEVIKIEAGHFHGLALTRDGEVYTWGCNELGGVGTGNEFELEPVKLDLPECRNISAAGEHSLAVTVDNRLYAWG
jgi:regulator of chromosome condensation